MRVFSRRPRRGLPGLPPVVRPSFRDPRFALLVAGEAVNSIGGWASAIVLWGFAAYRFNASPYAVSLTIVCWAAPPALLSPLMGVYIDRIGPRAAVVAGYCGAACAAVGMAAAGSLAKLAIAAVGYGSARARRAATTAARVQEGLVMGEPGRFRGNVPGSRRVSASGHARTVRSC